jgi:putrescine transport system substrate-binding protein
VPREGVLLTVDMMAIPADAPHPRNAHLWLNFLMRTEVIAAITNAVTHPNGYSASLPFLNEAIRNDDSIYPDAAARARFVTNNAVPAEYTRLVTREWTRFLTGY